MVAPSTAAADEVLHTKLRKGGLALNIGPDGEGQFLLVFERGGGKRAYFVPVLIYVDHLNPGYCELIVESN